MKREPIVVFGNSRFTEMIYKLIEKQGLYEVVTFCVDTAYLDGKNSFCGKPLKTLTEVSSLNFQKNCKALVAIGYSQMNIIRADKYTCMKNLGFKFINFIHNSSIIDTEHVSQDSNVILLYRNIAEQNVVINENVLIWSNVTISHDSIIEKNCFVGSNSSIQGNVTIKKNSFLGANCTILPGIKIDSYSLIGAGATISKDTAENEVWVPALANKLSYNSLDMKL